MISRFLTAASLACLTTLLITVPVLGHAELEESDPSEGDTIQTDGGYTFTATFSEEMLDGSRVVVRNSIGVEVASGGLDPDDATVLTTELPELEAGNYAARWTAITDDGHTERGTIRFSVEAATPTIPPRTPEASDTPSEEPSATPSAAATASDAPSASLSPAPTSTAGPTEPTSNNNDVILALALAAIAIGGVIAIVFMRGRD